MIPRLIQWLRNLHYVKLANVALSRIHGWLWDEFPDGHKAICGKCGKPIDAYTERCFYHYRWHHVGVCPEKNHE